MGTDQASAQKQSIEANRLMRYTASGSVRAADGTHIGFTVLVTLESRLAAHPLIDVSIGRVSNPTAEPAPTPEPPPEVDHEGSGADLEGHGFRFRFKADPNPAGQPRLMGTGLVVFEKTDKTPTVEDVKAALRGMQVI